MTGALAHYGTGFLVALAQDICKQNNKLTSDLIYRFVKDNVWTGKWAYTRGIMMSNYSAARDTIPDPVVGRGYYMFPVLQYFDGEGKIIFPPEWAEQKLQPKP